MDCLRELWIGQIDTGTRERKQQLLDAFNNPDNAPVFDGVARTGKRFRQVGFDTCDSVLDPEVDSERQQKFSILIHISDLDVLRSRIVNDLAAWVERPQLAACRLIAIGIRSFNRARLRSAARDPEQTFDTPPVNDCFPA